MVVKRYLLISTLAVGSLWLGGCAMDLASEVSTRTSSASSLVSSSSESVSSAEAGDALSSPVWEASVAGSDSESLSEVDVSIRSDQSEVVVSAGVSETASGAKRMLLVEQTLGSESATTSLCDFESENFDDGSESHTGSESSGYSILASEETGKLYIGGQVDMDDGDSRPGYCVRDLESGSFSKHIIFTGESDEEQRIIKLVYFSSRIWALVEFLNSSVSTDSALYCIETDGRSCGTTPTIYGEIARDAVAVGLHVYLVTNVSSTQTKVRRFDSTHALDSSYGSSGVYTDSSYLFFRGVEHDGKYVASGKKQQTFSGGVVPEKYGMMIVDIENASVDHFGEFFSGFPDDIALDSSDVAHVLISDEVIAFDLDDGNGGMDCLTTDSGCDVTYADVSASMDAAAIACTSDNDSVIVGSESSENSAAYMRVKGV